MRGVSFMFLVSARTVWRGALVTLICVTMLSPNAFAARTRLRFALGAITVRAYGRLTPAVQEARYVVAARAGQRMLVHTTGITPARDLAHSFTTIAIVTSPTGKQEGQKGVVSFDQTLTETGDYVIRVGPNMMASNVRGGPYLLEVVVY